MIKEGCENVFSRIHSHSYLSHRPQQSADHNHLNSDHPYLQPSIRTPSNTRFTQTLIVRSTLNSSQTLCARTCIYLPFQTPSDLLVFLHCSWFLLSTDPAKKDSHQNPAKTHWTDIFSKILTCHLLLMISFNSVNKSTCCFTYLLSLTLFMTLICIVNPFDLLFKKCTKM